MAFLAREKVRGRTVWRLYWLDATKGAGKAGQRAVNCESGNHAEAMAAAGLTGEERATLARDAGREPGRLRLLDGYRVLERQRRWRSTETGPEERERSGSIREDLTAVAVALASLVARVEVIRDRVPIPGR